ADLSYANFTGADLRDADFTGATLNMTVLDNCQTDGAKFDKADKPVFKFAGKAGAEDQG
ncbi:MAG TPA: hypothetical protein DEA55_11050, partial [Rhodospirillaceae bacterium]|nr:hypothetical protein [Rhodospirillaceae bacterium]